MKRNRIQKITGRCYTPGVFFRQTVIDTFGFNNLSLTVFVVQSSSNRLCFGYLSLTVFLFPNFTATCRSNIESGQFSDRKIFIRPVMALVWSLPFQAFPAGKRKVSTRLQFDSCTLRLRLYRHINCLSYNIKR